MKKIIVWHNLNKDIFYYKIVKGYYTDYKIGYKNQYNHEVILIIDDVYFETYKIPLKKRLLRKIISFLEKQIR